MYGFDRHPFLRSSNAAPTEQAPAINLRSSLKEVITNLTLLDHEQLAALYAAVEIEHVNRMAEMAGMEN